MGGEWSKLIGDTGEESVKRLLELIGWKPLMANYDIPCFLGPLSMEIKTGQQHRREHGLDGSPDVSLSAI